VRLLRRKRIADARKPLTGTGFVRAVTGARGKKKTGRSLKTEKGIMTRYFNEMERLSKEASIKINEFLEQNTGYSAVDQDEPFVDIFEKLEDDFMPQFKSANEIMHIELNNKHRASFQKTMADLYGANVSALMLEQGLTEAMEESVHENMNTIRTEFFHSTRVKMEKTIKRALINAEGIEGEGKQKSLKDLLWENIDKKKEFVEPHGRFRVPLMWSKDRIKFVARDQTNRFTGQLNRIRQKGAGIKKFKWSSSNDARVRRSHAALNGVTVEWDTGKIVDAPPNKRKYIGKTTEQVIKRAGGTPASDGIFPQQGFNCRCVAKPILEVE